MNRRRIGIVSMTIILLVLLYVAGSIWVSSEWLVVREYEYETDRAPTGHALRIVVLSDLHNHEFGKNNRKLVEKIEQQEPDLILLDGDFLNGESEDAHVPCTLIKSLKEVGPVYYALGNHEEEYMKEGHNELINELEASGAIVLDKEYADIDMNGISVRLGGMYDYAFGLDGNDSAEAAPDDVRKFLEEYQDTDRVKVMMAHRPDSFVFGNASSYWKVDLVISGHNHGGQVVIPGLGGLYGGDQGWFPQYVHGMYQKDQMSLLVTSGLGSHKQALPRFNNPPEVVVVTIKGVN